MKDGKLKLPVHRLNGGQVLLRSLIRRILRRCRRGEGEGETLRLDDARYPTYSLILATTARRQGRPPTCSPGFSSSVTPRLPSSPATTRPSQPERCVANKQVADVGKGEFVRSIRLDLCLNTGSSAIPFLLVGSLVLTPIYISLFQPAAIPNPTSCCRPLRLLRTLVHPNLQA